MTAGSAAQSASTRGRVLNVGLWVLQVLVAAMFVMAGWLKVTASPDMVEAFETIGAGQWFRVLLGVLELSGAVALLLPWLAGLAGLAFVGLTIGAAFTDVVILDHAPTVALVLLVAAALIAWGRWSSTVRLFRTVLRRG